MARAKQSAYKPAPFFKPNERRWEPSSKQEADEVEEWSDDESEEDPSDEAETESDDEEDLWTATSGGPLPDWSSLPRELIAKILQKVPRARSKVNAQLVCKEWRSVLGEVPAVWGTLRIELVVPVSRRRYGPSSYGHRCFRIARSKDLHIQVLCVPEAVSLLQDLLRWLSARIKHRCFTEVNVSVKTASLLSAPSEDRLDNSGQLEWEETSPIALEALRTLASAFPASKPDSTLHVDLYSYLESMAPFVSALALAPSAELPTTLYFEVKVKRNVVEGLESLESLPSHVTTTLALDNESSGTFRALESALPKLSQLSRIKLDLQMCEEEENEYANVVLRSPASGRLTSAEVKVKGAVRVGVLRGLTSVQELSLSLHPRDNPAQALGPTLRELKELRSLSVEASVSVDLGSSLAYLDKLESVRVKADNIIIKALPPSDHSGNIEQYFEAPALETKGNKWVWVAPKM